LQLPDVKLTKVGDVARLNDYGLPVTIRVWLACIPHTSGARSDWWMGQTLVEVFKIPWLVVMPVYSYPGHPYESNDCRITPGADEAPSSLAGSLAKSNTWLWQAWR